MRQWQSFWGGYGTKVDMTINVTPGDTLTIVVGEQPQLQVAGTDGCGGSGGGGTFVALDTPNSEVGDLTPLAVAGGGGGSYDASGTGTITVRTTHGHGSATITPVF